MLSEQKDEAIIEMLEVVIQGYLLTPIPEHIKSNTEELYGLNLMMCETELMNFAQILLRDRRINLLHTDEFLIFGGEYEGILERIMRDTSDVELKEYCQLALGVLAMLKADVAISRLEQHKLLHPDLK